MSEALPWWLEPHTKCNDCGVRVGELHVPGCDIERCALCGDQAIGCNCVYELNDIDIYRMEEEHPEIFTGGPTEAMERVYDAEVARRGGRIPMTPLFPGTDDCIRLDLWCYEDPVTRRCVPCDKSHPGAMPDLNRLAIVAVWDVTTRQFERRTH